MNAIILKLTHTVALPFCCRLSSTRIFVVSYGRLTKSSDEMSTKNACILVLVFVSMTKINLFSLTEFYF